MLIVDLRLTLNYDVFVMAYTNNSEKIIPLARQLVKDKKVDLRIMAHRHEAIYQAVELYRLMTGRGFLNRKDYDLWVRDVDAIAWKDWDPHKADGDGLEG